MKTMYKIATPLFLICETPLHAGSGDSLGVVDLPIQRERHTSFPKIEGSSLKGAIRQAYESLNTELIKKFIKNEGDEDILKKYQEAINLIFGPENAGNEGYAGAVGFTDARLLLFPVKSMKGVFAWITCPKVLQQFHRDMSLTDLKAEPAVTCALSINVLTSPLSCSADKSQKCGLFLSINSDKIVLEEYTFEIINKENPKLACLLRFLAEKIFPVPDSGQDDLYEFWRTKLISDVVVLPDEDFTDFVNLSTEVITRTKIKSETGTVEKGMLFTEEYLPAESVLYSLVLASPIFKEKDEEKGIFKKVNGKSEEELVTEFIKKGLPEVIQIGGNATLGKGLVRTYVVNSVAEAQRVEGENAPK
jgi:CRISPR-associated protein Cmr4